MMYQLELFSKHLATIKKGCAAFFGLESKGKTLTTRNFTKKRTPKAASGQRLLELWNKLRIEYFPEREDLDNYSVCWSRRRQLRTLASCCSEKRKINVAKELHYIEYEQWLPPLLFHEMCHAALGTETRNAKGQRVHHGKAFRNLERRHPLSVSLDRWIKSGGWLHAVRSHRAKECHSKKRSFAKA